MLEFTSRSQQYPDVQEAAKRRLNYKEIYANFDTEAAAEQAARCSQCGIPFCQVHCPLQNNIPDWLRLTAEGRLREAYEMSAATNTFPEICGRICPQDKLCEGNCVIERGFGSVTIGAVEKYITEAAFAEGWVEPPKPTHENGMSVGIIGAGPAGLAAAEQLRKAGFAVKVYDRHDRVGGLMIYGIPHFKLEKEIVARRHQWLADAGVEFSLNVEIGKDIVFDALREKHDAVLITTGVYKARALEVPDASPGGAVPALEYLTASNRRCLGDKVDGEDAKDKHVVVIGGGDTAMDCVRTAVRQGAKKVTCLYRRDRANMPGSAREVKNAEEEGVIFEWLATPRAVDKGEILVQRMRLLPPDMSGRQASVAVEGETFRLKADMVISALGFEPEELPRLWNTPGLEVTPQGTVKVDTRTQMTSLPGVFAAGDIVRGASLVVWAIKDGRDAALGIQHYLMREKRKAA